MLDVVMVGIGGYGNANLKPLLSDAIQIPFRIVGAVDPNPSRCNHLQQLQARNIPIFATLEEFFAQSRADLAILSTPIHLHAPQTRYAVTHGAHVLCEKPLCATTDQWRQMTQARDGANRHVAIGYQWSFSQAIQALKADILAGHFGQPRRMRTIVLWPRGEDYYSRNDWAGMKRNRRGDWVLDSPVNNACAHYLHNMLYLLGDRVDRSAVPTHVSAELYRAQAIDNYDTAALRCRTESGVEVLFIVSHSIAKACEPRFSLEFEKATIEYDGGADHSIVARFADGTVRNYGRPDGPSDQKIHATMDAILKGQPSLCGIEAASAHLRTMWAAQFSTPQIVEFPQDLRRFEGESGRRRTWVADLDTALHRCYDEWRLPAELGIAWAKPGVEVLVAETDERSTPPA